MDFRIQNSNSPFYGCSRWRSLRMSQILRNFWRMNYSGHTSASHSISGRVLCTNMDWTQFKCVWRFFFLAEAGGREKGWKHVWNFPIFTNCIVFRWHVRCACVGAYIRITKPGPVVNTFFTFVIGIKFWMREGKWKRQTSARHTRTENIRWMRSVSWAVPNLILLKIYTKFDDH